MFSSKNRCEKIVNQSQKHVFPVVFANTHPTAGAGAGIKVPPPQLLPSLAPILVEFTPITA